jgi:hypothetical protein
MNLAILSGILIFGANAITETAQFTIYQNGKKIGVEEFTISAHGGGYLAEGRTQISGDPKPITSRMELDEQLNPTSYEFTHGDGEIQVKFGKPTSEYEMTSGGQHSNLDFRFPDGGFVVDNNFFHHVLLLLYKAGVNGKTVPIFVPQDMRLGQATIQPKGNGVYQLQMGDVRLEATTDAAGKLIRLSVPDAKVVVER